MNDKLVFMNEGCRITLNTQEALETMQISKIRKLFDFMSRDPQNAENIKRFFGAIPEVREEIREDALRIVRKTLLDRKNPYFQAGEIITDKYMISHRKAHNRNLFNNADGAERRRYAFELKIPKLRELQKRYEKET